MDEIACGARLDSVFLGTDRQLLPLLFGFYAPEAIDVRDVTANTRKMWHGVSAPKGTLWYDIDPAMNPDVVCSWNALPDRNSSVDVLVYDPPHLPLAAVSMKSARGSAEPMRTSYGLERSVEGDNIATMHSGFLLEAKRVLKPDGLIFAKIKDYIHNHRYQWNLEIFNCACRNNGLTPCDLIVKRDPCGGNLKSGRWLKSYHAKNVHCYWVIIRNSSSCETKNKQITRTDKNEENRVVRSIEVFEDVDMF